MLEDVLFLDKFNRAKHALVVHGRKSGDDLQKEVVMGIRACVVGGQDLEDVAIKIEGVFEVGDLVLELVVLLPEHLLHLY